MCHSRTLHVDADRYNNPPRPSVDAPHTASELIVILSIPLAPQYIKNALVLKCTR